jgi:hypothetical protein
MPLAFFVVRAKPRWRLLNDGSVNGTAFHAAEHRLQCSLQTKREVFSIDPRANLFAQITGFFHLSVMP